MRLLVAAVAVLMLGGCEKWCEAWADPPSPTLVVAPTTAAPVATCPEVAGCGRDVWDSAPDRECVARVLAACVSRRCPEAAKPHAEVP